MKKQIFTSLALVAAVGLSGCSQNPNKTKEEKESEANVATVLGAIGGAVLARQMGVDSRTGTVIGGVIGGVTARKIYQDVNKDTANDPNTNVEAVNIDGQEYIKVDVRDVNFRSGSAHLDPEMLDRLGPVLNALRNYPNTRVHIEGHTDSDGSRAFNQQLSENRSKNVAFYLMDNGISRDRIITYGYGEDRPIASNDTPEGKRMNRRVTFLISEY
ncbi:OmpA family protein [Thiomicrorhabdus xiamenensis]|uniref:OmpA family protein n=1 Tax=Thiomicrorhabdus xiamenensis TaxID=2739063 RepID=A0A7D4NZH7_9GAMM|nr:OmpA family protein [Thiomicrorhabdus xiamenensis]QKI89758.1 OmpA family protein [Thiomicrorhabdus xiamenensis]